MSRVWPSDSKKCEERQERETLSNGYRHIINWMLGTGDLITSTGVRRDVNNSVFVAGLKLIRGLIWSLKSEHRAWARHHRDKKRGCHHLEMEQAVVNSPKTSDFHNRALTTSGARNVSTLRRQKSQQQTWKKSTCQDLRRCECDEWPYCYPEASVLSDHNSGVKTRQTSPDQYCSNLRRTQTTFLCERRWWPESNSEKNLSHPLQCPSPAGQLSSSQAGHSQCKHHSQFLLEEQVIPVIIRYTEWHVLFRQKKIFK